MIPSSSNRFARLRTWAEINLAALEENLATVRRIAGPDRAVMAIVKANAYGHGLAEVATALAGKVDWFGVANPREALTVAQTAPGDILLLGPLLPEERDLMRSPRFVAAISSLEEARGVQELGCRVRVHLCVDTGMGRIGCQPEEIQRFVQEVSRMSNLQLEGFCSHFPSADEDPEFTRHQIETVGKMLGSIPSLRWVHLDNSAGVLDFLEGQPYVNLVRPGLMLYGLCPEGVHQDQLNPVLSLRSRVTLVRELPAGHGVSYGRTFITTRPTKVATVGIGYGDGYPRHLSNQGASVLIMGQRCPIIGRVTMDQIMIDVTDLPGTCRPGEIVTLIGADGDERILASEVAAHAGTISWHILAGLTTRVERIVISRSDV